VTIEHYVDGRGEDARKVKRIRFRLADKLAALLALGKHLDIFNPERREVTAPAENIDIRQVIINRLERIRASEQLKADASRDSAITKPADPPVD